MLEQDVKYSIESEIDKTFPYLDRLDEEINQLKKSIDKKSPVNRHKKFNFLNIFLIKKPIKETVKINNNHPKLRRKTLKYHNYSKDGYIFRIQLIQKYDDISVKYFEFSVNITFNDLIKKDQFYKKFETPSEAKQYYSNMEGVFKHLKRRDLIERLFKEKLQEIDKYKSIL